MAIPPISKGISVNFTADFQQWWRLQMSEIIEKERKNYSHPFTDWPVGMSVGIQKHVYTELLTFLIELIRACQRRLANLHIFISRFASLVKYYRIGRKTTNKQTNTYIESSPLSVKAANVDLCLALMSIELWGFFSVPRLLWHETSDLNGHLRGPVTLTPIAERLAMELSLLAFYDLCLSWLGFEHPTFHLRGVNSLTHCATVAVILSTFLMLWSWFLKKRSFWRISAVNKTF